MIRTLAAALATSTCIIALATPAAAQTREYDIPAGSLKAALDAYVRQSGRQIVYRADQVRPARSPGVRGSLTPEAALAALLSGSGFTTRTDGKLVAIVKSGNGPAATADVASTGAEAGAAEGASSDIIVTGSRVRGAPVTSRVISVNSEEIERSGLLSTSAVLRSIPQNFAGGLNPTVVQAGGSAQNQDQFSGASSANLRGLGSDSTLTLINGRRLAFADNISSVDVSIVPLSAIERIEVLTDGASAIYGSDAVGGVVNFILKDRFSGVETRATYGNSTRGGGELKQIGAIAGTTWSGGGIFGTYEFSGEDAVFARDRSFIDPTIGGLSLQPRSRRHSGFVRLGQDISNNINFFADGLYTRRYSYQTTDFGLVAPGLFSSTDAKVDQYGVSTGLRADVSAWNLGVVANIAQNKADDPNDIFQDGNLLFRIDQHFKTTSKQIEATVNGPLVLLPAGTLQVALGASVRREGFVQDQTLLGDALIDISAHRNVESAYAEASIPLIAGTSGPAQPALLLNAAIRYDHYSDAGSTTNPRIGMLFRPVPELALKASWGTSFRAPSLFQLNRAQIISFGTDVDPLSPTGISFALSRAGGNKDLKPESAETWSVSADYEPLFLPNFQIGVTYYDIRYSDRLTSPVQGSPLSNPANEPFIIRDPTDAQLAAAFEGSTFQNFSGTPYDPALVAAIIDNRLINASSQRIRGVDLLGSYVHRIKNGELTASLNATYLDLSQRITTLSPSQQLSGTVFYPSKYRARGSVGWSTERVSLTGILNYVGPSTYRGAAADVQVGAWATVDGQIAFKLGRSGLLERTRFLISAQNLLNSRPPRVPAEATLLPGLNYDSTNSSALGRFISAQVIVGW